jgi:hypothetical protein
MYVGRARGLFLSLYAAAIRLDSSRIRCAMRSREIA